MNLVPGWVYRRVHQVRRWSASWFSVCAGLVAPVVGSTFGIPKASHLNEPGMILLNLTACTRGKVSPVAQMANGLLSSLVAFWDKHRTPVTASAAGVGA